MLNSPHKDATKPTQVKQTRSTDGCQNCKLSRVKCDRKKPSCACCVRRGETCNYSKIQFNTINKRTHDKRTGRKARMNSKKTCSGTLSGTENLGEDPGQVSLQRKPFQIIMEDPGAAYTSFHKGSCKSSRTSRGGHFTPEPNGIKYELVAPSSDITNVHTFNARNLFTDSNTHDLEILAPQRRVTLHVATPSSRYDDVNVDDQPADHNALLYPETKVGYHVHEVRCSRYSSKVTSDYNLSKAWACPSLIICNSLERDNTQLLLTHYLSRSVLTLHPRQKPTNNSSTILFLPFCLHHPAAIEGLLAFSAAQLGHISANQSEALLYHKNRSIVLLNRLVSEESRRLKDCTRKKCSLELIICVLIQISLAVTESGMHTWQSHCDAAYMLLESIDVPTIIGKVDTLETYVYCRILKYICFAEIAQPSERELNLTRLEGHSIDSHLGVPMAGLRLAVLISRYCKALASNDTSELGEKAQVIEVLLQRYTKVELCKYTEHSEDWLIEVIWQAAILLYYERMIYETTAYHLNSIQGLSYILEYLGKMSSNSVYYTALAFPLTIIAPLLHNHTVQMRTWFIVLCHRLARTTNTGNFHKIAEFAELCWREMDKGRCTLIRDIHRLAAETGYVILAA